MRSGYAGKPGAGSDAGAWRLSLCRADGPAVPLATPGASPTGKARGDITVAEAADMRGRVPQLTRRGAGSAATCATPRVSGARAWTAPRIERSGLAIRDTIAPKICEVFVVTARREDVSPPRRRLAQGGGRNGPAGGRRRGRRCLLPCW